MRPLAVLGSALLSVGVMQGCLSTGNGMSAGVGGYSYTLGTLSSLLDVPITLAYPASRAALEELQLIVVESDLDSNDATIHATQADGTEIKLRLQRTDFNGTRVKIRVGMIGNEEQSRLIMERIRRNIATSPGAPRP